MSAERFEERRERERIVFRTVCGCGAASPWTLVAGMAHGWIGAHRDQCGLQDV